MMPHGIGLYTSSPLGIDAARLVCGAGSM